MEESAHRLFLREFVVELDRLGRREHVRCDLTFLQEFQSFAGNVEAFLHSSGEHDDFRIVIEQFLHVGWLNARRVPGPGFSPVPFARSARKQLCVLVGLVPSFDLKPPPRDMFDSRRRLLVLHIKRSTAGSRAVVSTIVSLSAKHFHKRARVSRRGAFSIIVEIDMHGAVLF